ncbi:MAG: VCBS repeat-containing protein [Candidatus Eremiobacteraeota bacterium]|nr:VCBS repeat-containing protein [Candidatus Eremiobacteraeota bacterium]
MKGWRRRFFWINLAIFNTLLVVLLLFIFSFKEWKLNILQKNSAIEVRNKDGLIDVKVEDRQFTKILKKLKKANKENKELSKELKSTENHLQRLSSYLSECRKSELFRTYSDYNSAILKDLDQDGKDELICWGSDVFIKIGNQRNDIAGIRIYAASGDKAKCFKVFERTSMGRFMSVKTADLDGNGTQEVLVKWDSGGSGGYGENDIIFYEKGKYREYSSDKLSAYPVKFQDVDKDGRTEILARIHFPKGLYKCGEVPVPMLYQWNGSRAVSAPRYVKAYYYESVFIPDMQCEIAYLEKENKRINGSDSRKSRNIRHIEYRKRAIEVARDLIEGNTVRDPGWRGPGD